MNNPLPGWWLSLFYLMIAFAILYLVLYPGVFKGVKKLDTNQPIPARKP